MSDQISKKDNTDNDNPTNSMDHAPGNKLNTFFKRLLSGLCIGIPVLLIVEMGHVFIYLLFVSLTGKIY